MARRTHRPAPTRTDRLTPWRTEGAQGGQPLWVAYTSRRCVTTFQGVCQLTRRVRACYNPACSLYRRPYRPEEEGHWAFPHGEFGRDVIGLVGLLRYGEQRSLPEIHHRLLGRGVPLAERTLDHLMDRSEDLVALPLSCPARLEARLREQGQVILAIDGLPPDVGHEVLWIIRDGLSGEILLARALLSRSQEDVRALLQEVKDHLTVPARGLISDGQATICDAIACIFPRIPHQVCQVHSLREAAKPIFEADRHAKKELRQQIRGIRPIERALQGRTDAEAEALRRYGLAGRSALTDDGSPPLCASGLKWHDRLPLMVDSLAQLEQKRGCPQP